MPAWAESDDVLATVESFEEIYHAERGATMDTYHAERDVTVHTQFSGAFDGVNDVIPVGLNPSETLRYFRR